MHLFKLSGEEKRWLKTSKTKRSENLIRTIKKDIGKNVKHTMSKNALYSLQIVFIYI